MKVTQIYSVMVEVASFSQATSESPSLCHLKSKQIWRIPFVLHDLHFPSIVVVHSLAPVVLSGSRHSLLPAALL